MNQQLKWMKKIILVAIVMLVGIWLQPIEVKAQLCKTAHLRVAGVEMVKNGIVQQAKVEDGMGGSATYDEENNTLTLKNFHYVEGHGTKYYIYGYDMSVYQTLHIVLIGTNDLRRNDRMENDSLVDNGAINLDDEVILEGIGRLITNTRVTFGKAEIRDCTVEISGMYYGMCVPFGLLIDNANVTLVSENYREYCAALYLDGGEFEVHDSIVKIKNSSGFINSFMSKMVDNNPNNLYDSEQWIKLGDDMVVTDEEGNPLTICGCACWKNYYFCFSNKDGVTEQYVNDDEYISHSVYMISAKKSALTAKIKEVQTLIDAIGTVQLDSEEKIKAARVAYDGLSEFGDKADYARKQIVNYEKLTQAETTHAALVQKEKERLEAEEAARKAEEEAQRLAAEKAAAEEAERLAAEEAAKKAKEEAQSKGDSSQKENEKNQGDENQGGNDSGDKGITVKNKKYVIKTPKLKSVKSKRKKTVTIKFTTSKDNTGYQISYAQNKTFKKAKKVTIKNKKSKTATIKKLKSKKNYYIRVRAYRKINGKTYYGNWSNVKKIRVK